MSVKVLQHELGLDIEPPESFDHTTYRELYLQNESYFHEGTELIDPKYIMYHHYLNYGKSYGHSCNHNIIVFFHIPKCGGTSIHYGIILPNLFRQYHTDKYYLYNINWIDQTSKRNLFSTISYTENPELLSILKKEDTILNKKLYLKQTSINLNDTNLDLVFKYSTLLSIIFNAGGFQDSDVYLQELISRSNKKIYDKYIILREPQSFYESIFYYLRDVGTWEKTYGEFSSDMSFKQYIKHPDNYINNWLIRHMTKITDSEMVTDEHIDICIQKLMSFTKIGFLEYFDSFVSYLCKKYNWQLDDNSTINLNKNIISKKEKLSEEDRLLLQNKLYYDKEVYGFFLSKYKPNVNIS